MSVALLLFDRFANAGMPAPGSASRIPARDRRHSAVECGQRWNAGRPQTALGAFYRRLAFQFKAKAITATARKLAIRVYRTLKNGLVYIDPGPAAYDAQHRTRPPTVTTANWESRVGLIDLSTGELVEGSVS